MTAPGHRLPPGVAATPVLDEPVHLFTGPGHPYADAPAIAPAHLTGHRIWMPGNAPGTEWTACYEALAEAFGFVVDTVGPDFGIEPLLDTIAGSTALAAFVSRQTPLVWPAGHAPRRIPLANPTPVYPHCLIWRPDNPHPSLAALRDRPFAARPVRPEGGVWVWEWSRSRTGDDRSGP